MPQVLKTVSLETEIDEDVYQRVRDLIEANRNLDQDKLITAALLMYLPHAEAISSKAGGAA